MMPLIELSCSCGQRLRAIASSPNEVRFYCRRTSPAAWEHVTHCPNCQRDFSRMSADDLKELLGANWS